MKQNPHPPRPFGELVEARIREKGLTLRDITEATGMPLATLHRRLKDPGLSMTLGELKRIAPLLDATAAEIVAEFEGAA